MPVRHAIKWLEAKIDESAYRQCASVRSEAAELFCYVGKTLVHGPSYSSICYSYAYRRSIVVISPRSAIVRWAHILFVSLHFTCDAYLSNITLSLPAPAAILHASTWFASSSQSPSHFSLAGLRNHSFHSGFELGARLKRVRARSSFHRRHYDTSDSYLIAYDHVPELWDPPLALQTKINIQHVLSH